MFGKYLFTGLLWLLKLLSFGFLSVVLCGALFKSAHCLHIGFWGDVWYESARNWLVISDIIASPYCPLFSLSLAGIGMLILLGLWIWSFVEPTANCGWEDWNVVGMGFHSGANLAVGRLVR